MGRSKLMNGTSFRRGHPYHPKRTNSSENTLQHLRHNWTSRLSDTVYGEVVSLNSEHLPDTMDADGKSTFQRILRPAKRKETVLEHIQHKNCDLSENRLVNKSQMLDMFNASVSGHYIHSPSCHVPSFEVSQEIKKGTAWRMSLLCSKCNYISPLYKLYREVQTTSLRRGAKTACTNVALATALQDTTIGKTKASMILTAINMPPPTLKSMQSTANQVASQTSMMVEDDLHHIRENIKTINMLRGLSPEAPTNISLDCSYNSICIGSRKKMGQNASQAVGLAISHQSEEKKVVSLYLENKLCWNGAWLRNRGYDVTCPGGHIGCTATKAKEDPLSEYDIGRSIGREFASQGLPLKYVVTDGDGCSAKGVEKAFSDSHVCSANIVRQADPTHLGQSQFRYVMRKANFSAGMFPGESADDRAQQKKLLALDMKSRSYHMHNNLFKKYGGDMDKITSEMPRAIQTAIKCYAKNHKDCRYKSGGVCCGGIRKNWWNKSPYLNTFGLTRLNMGHDDLLLLENIFNMKLGAASLQLMKTNISTNKNEATNRAITASLPKNVKFPRTSKARALSAIHRINYGPGHSLYKKLEVVGCSIASGGYVAHAIKDMQDTFNYKRRLAKNKKIQKEKFRQKVNSIRQFYAARTRRRNVDIYSQGQLDPSVSGVKKRKYRRKLQPKAHTLDHPYSNHN